MTIEERMQSVLVGAAGVTAHTTTIKYQGDWQNMPAKWIRHHCVDQNPIYLYDGSATEWRGLYQVSCFAVAELDAGRMRDAVRTALEADITIDAFLRGISMLYESDTKIHHAAMTFEIHTNL